MNVFEILNSVSKIAIVAFVITLGIVIYEIYLTAKKHKETVLKKDIKLPEFKQNSIDTLPTSPHIKKIKTLAKKKDKISFVVMAVSLALLLAGAFVAYKIYTGQRGNIREERPIEIVPIPTILVEPSPEEEKEATQSFSFGLGDNEPLAEEDKSAVSTTDTDKEISPTPSLTSAPTKIPTPYPEGVDDDGDDLDIEYGGSDTDQETYPPKITPGLTAAYTSVSPTMMLSGTITKNPSTTTTGTVPSKLPESGIYTQSLIIAVISIGLIAFAFIL